MTQKYKLKNLFPVFLLVLAAGTAFPQNSEKAVSIEFFESGSLRTWDAVSDCPSGQRPETTYSDETPPLRSGDARAGRTFSASLICPGTALSRIELFPKRSAQAPLPGGRNVFTGTGVGLIPVSGLPREVRFWVRTQGRSLVPTLVLIDSSDTEVLLEGSALPQGRWIRYAFSIPEFLLPSNGLDKASEKPALRLGKIIFSLGEKNQNDTAWITVSLYGIEAVQR